MKKKAIYLIGIAIVLLICIVASYFKPLSLSNTVSENSKISMVFNEYVIKNDAPGFESTEYKDFTTEQKDAILTLLEKYTYRRTFGTPFSNGSMSGIGTGMLTINVFDDNSSDIIFVTSSGKIVVNAKNYYMENAEQFIEQIIEIVEETD